MQNTPDAELLQGIRQLGDHLKLDSFEALGSGVGLGEVCAVVKSRPLSREATSPLGPKEVIPSSLDSLRIGVDSPAPASSAPRAAKESRGRREKKSTSGTKTKTRIFGPGPSSSVSMKSSKKRNLESRARSPISISRSLSLGIMYLIGKVASVLKSFCSFLLDGLFVATILCVGVFVRGLLVGSPEISPQSGRFLDFYPVKILMETSAMYLMVVWLGFFVIYFVFFRIFVGFSVGQFMVNRQKRSGHTINKNRNITN